MTRSGRSRQPIGRTFLKELLSAPLLATSVCRPETGGQTDFRAMDTLLPKSRHSKNASFSSWYERTGQNSNRRGNSLKWMSRAWITTYAVS